MEKQTYKLPSTRIWLSYILTILLPFIFLLFMSYMKDVIDEPKPFIHTLQHPQMLMISALFSKIGAHIGLKYVIKNRSELVSLRIQYTSFGVMGVLLIMAILHLVLNGGWSNPQ